MSFWPAVLTARVAAKFTIQDLAWFCDPVLRGSHGNVCLGTEIGSESGNRLGVNVNRGGKYAVVATHRSCWKCVPGEISVPMCHIDHDREVG